MPTTKPGFIWSGTEWVAIGQEAIVNPFYYQATAPTTPSTGDIWIESDVNVPSVDSAQFLRWRKTMTGGETSLSGNDDSSLPLAYTPGYEQLYINGVLMVRGVDYTATTGTTVTALTALVANDVVEIFSVVARTVADVYTQTQSDARFVNKNAGGLNLVVPTSVTGGTVSANGAVTIGSAVSTITISGAFSAAYDNYLITINGGVGSTTAALRLKMGTADSPYYGAGILVSNSTGGTSTVINSGTSFLYAGAFTTSNIQANVYVQNPFLAKTTVFRSDYQVQTNGGSSAVIQGYLDTNTSYADCSIITNSGTITGGTIRIYGYNNGA